jgi:uncharacterized protein (TIGR03083 family)
VTDVRETAIRVEDIAPIGHREAMALAEVEYERFGELLCQLAPGDWSKPTVCTEWDVRQLVAHNVGAIEAQASLREQAHQMRVGMRIAKEKNYDHWIHGVTELQVGERSSTTPAELVARWRSTAPKALKARRRFPPFLRPLKVDFGPVLGKRPMGSYLIDVVMTRDVWMHRIDLCRAVGVEPVLTAEHDGRLVQDMVADWQHVHGHSFVLELEGPAGGLYVSGDGRERLAMDAMEWIWTLSGRGTGSGLLEKELPL